ncbi:hypothetical protein L226DRAFT_327636 [Lentinus tigrinus ALCF2SS1-7]|uniref:Carbohydrate-binding module family 19 domain-containing protein n=1 Tax=Lentinus tigrinus ALCF2SS1-6 TaxID=1328759 RepID=A0A5C2SG41_9APHY|nr:hypothetical protein L227DRAFT_609194 [Lentinus tigrinus ALCF2SS1-6]RPD77631.1 hypothetical protein L226DRAFT_327636 [Lentinus tigrinus ALCF2SS1-7]
MKYSVFVALSLALAASARPSFISSKRADFTLKNGQDAIALNDKFKTLTPDSSCNAGDIACVDDKFAQCVGGKFVLQACGGGTICAALPLVNSAGTSVTCTTAADRDARIAATGATAASGSGNKDTGSKGGDNAANGNAAASSTAAAPAASNTAAAAGGDPQTSTTLDPKSIQANFAQDGSANASAGQEPSLTSTNNFINFCLQFPGKAQTNGKQVIEGSCNATPMGVIAAKDKMPFAKFQNPTNGGTIPANKDFNIDVLVKNMELGHFTNPDTTFHMAPQVVNDAGLIKGHSHVVVQAIASADSKDPLDPTKFAFFKGLNDKGNNGVLSVTVPGGLPKGTYRVATINSSANHQPALVAIAQRGSLDDMVYFTVA